MESLIQKLHPGVVIHFQKLPVSLAVPNKLQVQQSQLGRASPTPMETEQTNSTDPVKMDTGHLSGIAHFNHLKADDTGRDTPPPLSYTQQQPKTTWEDTKKMIYIKTSPKGVLTGHWPIPESFWPDISMQTLVSWSLANCIFREPATFYSRSQEMPTLLYGLIQQRSTHYLLRIFHLTNTSWSHHY